MNPNNVFDIVDPTYLQEQDIISNFFFEIWKRQTAVGESISDVECAGYNACHNLHKNINKYPSWKLIRDADPTQNASYIMALMNLYHHLSKKKPVNPANWDYFTRIIEKQLIGRLMKKSIMFSKMQIVALLDMLIKEKMEDFPVGLWIQQLDSFFAHDSLTAEVAGKLLKYKEQLNAKQGADLQIILQKHQGDQKLTEVTFTILSKQESVFSEILDDPFALSVDAFLKSQKGQGQKYWNDIFFMANTLAYAVKPPKKDKIDQLLKAVTGALFKKQLLEWLLIVNKNEPVILELSEYYNKVGMMNDYSIDILKGLIWIGISVMDKSLMNAIVTLASGCNESLSSESQKLYNHLQETKCDQDRDTHFTYLPDRLAVACFKALGAMPGNEGIEQLIALRNRIKTGSKVKAIDKIIEQGAKARGISKSELEDAAAPEL